jgi:ABC-type sugar transport system ATPase subunit
MKSLFGLLAPDGGDITLDGRPVRFTDPAAAMRAGLFMISEDRQGEGIIQTAPILQNMAISNIIVRGREDGTAPLGILRWPRIRRICAEIAAAIRIKAASLDASILSLSGGNQQKVILGRCLMNRPRLILADEPTRGVSIGSKIEIYKALRDLAASGVSILVASSEFDELVGLCNRIYLIDRGRTVGEIANTGLTSHELLNLVLSASARRPQAA